jgi:hypothetical protein
MGLGACAGTAAGPLVISTEVLLRDKMLIEVQGHKHERLFTIP